MIRLCIDISQFFQNSCRNLIKYKFFKKSNQIMLSQQRAVQIKIPSFYQNYIFLLLRYTYIHVPFVSQKKEQEFEREQT